MATAGVIIASATRGASRVGRSQAVAKVAIGFVGISGYSLFHLHLYPLIGFAGVLSL